MFDFSTIHQILYMYTIPMILAGVKPFSIYRKGKKVTFRARKPNVINCANIAVIVFVLYYTQYLRFTSMNSEDFASFVGIVSTLSALAQVAVASIIVYLFKHKHLIEAVDKLSEIDDELRALKLRVSYKHWFMYTGIYCSFTFTIIPMLLQAERSTYKKILDAFSGHYPGCIRCGLICLPLLVISVLCERFRYINNLLEELDDDETVFNQKKKTNEDINSALVILIAVTKIHAGLVDIANHVSDCFGLILLLNILTNIIQLVMAIFLFYAGNFKELGLLELVIPFLVYSVQMGMVYLAAFLTEIEAQETLTMLGHLNICYLDNEVATVRNTLLLQGQHHKVIFSVCDLFPLNCSIFLSQVNICQTVILLLIQHYKALTEAQDMYDNEM